MFITDNSGQSLGLSDSARDIVMRAESHGYVFTLDSDGCVCISLQTLDGEDSLHICNLDFFMELLETFKKEADKI